MTGVPIPELRGPGRLVATICRGITAGHDHTSHLVANAIGGVGGVQLDHVHLGRYRGHGVAVPAIVEVGVDCSQARHFESFMQFAAREGMETDPVLPRLDPAAVLEEEHEMGDVLLVETVRYLPGVQDDAPAAVPGHRPVGDLHDPALGMELLPVTGIDHHVSAGADHLPEAR